MSYSNIYQPCEHVTLFFTGQDGTYKGSTEDRINYYFDIPASKYFSQDRGSMCTLEVLSGNMTQGSEQNMSCSFHLVSGSANGFTVNTDVLLSDDAKADEEVKNVTDTVCIAHACEKNSNTGGEIRGVGEVLVGARPERLHIKLVWIDGASADGDGGIDVPPSRAGGVMTIKFTYYDPVQSTVNMKNHQDYRQLKGGRSSYI